MTDDDTVMKVVINYDKYIKFKTLEKRLEECEAKLKKELSMKNEIQPDDDGQDIEEDDKSQVGAQVEQIGKGVINLHELNHETLKLITDSIYQRIKEDFNISPKLEPSLPQPSTSASSIVEQIGLGDLLQEAPVESLMDTTPEPSAPLVIHKSQQHDQFDHSSIIKTLPAPYQKRAAELLIVFDSNPSEITFDESGIIYIDQKSLPNSNFFKILPELYKTKPKTKLPGFDELVTRIASLGFGHLINRTLTLGLNRKKAIDRNAYLAIKDLKNWFYLGP